MTALLVVVTVATLPAIALNAVTLIGTGNLVRQYKRGSDIHREALSQALVTGGVLAVQVVGLSLLWTATGSVVIACCCAVLLITALTAFGPVQRRLGVDNTKLAHLVGGRPRP